MTKLTIGVGEDFPVDERQAEDGGCRHRGHHYHHDSHRHGHHHHEHAARWHRWVHEYLSRRRKKKEEKKDGES